MTEPFTKPDRNSPVPVEFYAYVAKLGEALAEVQNNEDLISDSPLEPAFIDNVPVYWYGEVAGYLVISEADGKSWDYCPAIVLPAVSERDITTIRFAADRFVNVGGESENVDFVLRLREVADKLEALGDA